MTKEHFTHAVFTEHTRSFTREWDGSGVDTDLVDPEALRENWLSASPHAPTLSLLQQGWLRTLPVDGYREATAAPSSPPGTRGDAAAPAAR